MSFLKDDEPSVDGHTREDVNLLISLLYRKGMPDLAEKAIMGLYSIRKPTDAFYERLATTLPAHLNKRTSGA